MTTDPQDDGVLASIVVLIEWDLKCPSNHAILTLSQQLEGGFVF